MKLQITFNSKFQNQLVTDSRLFRQLSYDVDKNGNITKFFILNKVENNDEITFRLLSLQLIKDIFSSVFEFDPERIDFDRGFTNPKPRCIFIMNYPIRDNLIAKLGDDIIE